jgi:hypothetical protein
MVDVPRREDRLVDALSEQYQHRNAALRIAREHPRLPGVPTDRTDAHPEDDTVVTTLVAGTAVTIARTCDDCGTNLWSFPVYILSTDGLLPLATKTTCPDCDAIG